MVMTEKIETFYRQGSYDKERPVLRSSNRTHIYQVSLREQVRL